MSLFQDTEQLSYCQDYQNYNIATIYNYVYCTSTDLIFFSIISAKDVFISETIQRVKVNLQ
jgi:hypothetical protein